jgi:hypothetical protein
VKNPDGQTLQEENDVAPFNIEYRPPAQLIQEFLRNKPSTGEYLPAGQSLHEVSAL